MSVRGERCGCSTVEHVVLGLVASLGPCAACDLEREVERMISHFWMFSHAAIDQAPPQLVAAGLLTDEQESQGRRRRLYRITEAGREELSA